MIEEGLLTFVKADATVGGLISDRMYGVKLPQQPTLPAIVFFRVSGERIFDTDGETGLADGRFQFDCWDDNLRGARELAEAVRKRLSGYSGAAGGETVQGAFLENDQDLYDSELDAHRVMMDYLVWYNETT